MRHRSLGDTGIEVSELALGTWGLSGDAYGPIPEEEQDRVIDRAHALGIDLFDTADTYAHGAMEERLGKRLPKSATIVTKIGTDRETSPPRKRFTARFLRQAFEASRARLGRERLDVVLLHNPSEQALARDETTGVMKDLVAEKALRAWGVSAGSEAVAREAVARGAAVVEIAYNVFHSTDLQALSDVLSERRVGVLARSVLSYGLLCGHWPPHKTFARGDHRVDRWTPDELRRRVRQLDAVRSLVGGPVLTVRGGALRFVLANDVVSAAVLGPRNVVQLDQLVREAGREPPYLSDEKLAKLATRLGDVGVSA